MGVAAVAASTADRLKEQARGKQPRGEDRCGAQFCHRRAAIPTFTAIGSHGDDAGVGACIASAAPDRLNDHRGGELPLIGRCGGTAPHRQPRCDHGAVLQDHLCFLAIAATPADGTDGLEAGLPTHGAAAAPDALGEHPNAVVAVGVDAPAIHVDRAVVGIAAGTTFGIADVFNRRAARHRATTTTNALGIDADGVCSCGGDHTAVNDAHHIAHSAGSPRVAVGHEGEAAVAGVAALPTDRLSQQCGSLGRTASGEGELNSAVVDDADGAGIPTVASIAPAGPPGVAVAGITALATGALADHPHAEQIRAGCDRASSVNHHCNGAGSVARFCGRHRHPTLAAVAGIEAGAAAVAAVARQGRADQAKDVGVALGVEDRVEAVEDLSIAAQIDHNRARIASGSAAAAVIAIATVTPIAALATRR